MDALLQMVPQGTPLELTLGWFTGFVLLQSASVKTLSRWRGVRDMAHDEQFRLFVLVPSTVHAVLANALALVTVLGPVNDALAADPVRGSAPLTLFLHAMSCGYFLFDFVVVMHHEPVDLKFLAHAVVCGLAYWVAQQPLFHYYTTRFLLFELSTPLLNLRTLMVLLKANETATALVGKMVGATFVGCRIVYGLPLAFGFLQYLQELIARKTAGEDGALPSLAALYFSSAAIFSMSLLNVVWFVSALINPPKTDELHEGMQVDAKKDD